jgi:hypothetical protein
VNKEINFTNKDINFLFMSLIFSLAVTLNKFNIIFLAILLITIASGMYVFSLFSVKRLCLFSAGAFLTDVAISNRFMTLPLYEVSHKITFVLFFCIFSLMIINISFQSYNLLRKRNILR